MSICSAQSSCGHRSYLKRRHRYQREKNPSNVSKPDLALDTRERARHEAQDQHAQRPEISPTNDAPIDRRPSANRSGKNSLHTTRHTSSFHPSVQETWYPSRRLSPRQLDLGLLPGISLLVNAASREAERVGLSTVSSMSSVAATSSAPTITTVSLNPTSPTPTPSTSTLTSTSSTSLLTSAASLSSTAISSSVSTSLTSSSVMSTTASSSSTSELSSSNTQSSPSTLSISASSSLSSTVTLSSISSRSLVPTSMQSSTVSTSLSSTSRLPSSTPLNVSSTVVISSSTLPSSVTMSTSSYFTSSSSSLILPSASSSTLSTSISESSSVLTGASSSSIITLTSSSDVAPSTTRPTFTYTPSLKHTSSLVTSSSTFPPNPSLAPSLASNTNFSPHTGAIIGATIGGAIALVAAAFAIFLICGRIRRNRLGQILGGRELQGGRGNRGVGPTAGPFTEEMVEQGAAPLGKKLGFLARGISLGSSSRPLNRTTSSVQSTAAWRSPLSDEDGDEEYPGVNVPLPASPVMTAPGYGLGFGEGSSSGHGHDPGSSSGHEHFSGSVESSGSTYNASSVQSSRSQGHNMPGFGQAAETMAGMGASGGVHQTLSSSHGHSTLLNQDRTHSSGTISSTKVNMNDSSVGNSAGEGSGSSNSHSHSLHTTAQAQTLAAPIPKLKVNDRSVPPTRSPSPKSFKRGFIERLRGGRSSTQSSMVVTPPASSSYYPSTITFPARSSLLNPPLPVSEAPLEPPVMSFLQPPLPLPSPALTDDSRMAYTDGLLNPAHGLRTTGEMTDMSRPQAGNDSSLSLGDHVDYSRPFGGFVFNRMDSSTTFTSADTRTTTHPVAESPLHQQHDLPPEHLTGDDGV
ncbi:hypothetical protein FB446DRAFT_491529 [Lentinula raphanica]|nr:hypothetical protein FB446DRAFT_491529 [Lentinula raphanica]